MDGNNNKQQRIVSAETDDCVCVFVWVIYVWYKRLSLISDIISFIFGVARLFMTPSRPETSKYFLTKRILIHERL